MGLAVAHWWWLLVGLAAIPSAWAALRWLGAMTRFRAWTVAIARVALFLLLASALAGVSALRTSDRVAVVVVLDQSESVRRLGGLSNGASAREAASAWLTRAAASREPDDLLGVVVFDGRSLALAAPRSGGAGGASAGDIPDLSLDLPRTDGTDIAGALKFAASLLPPDAAGRLVLVSDGNETSADALKAADDLVRAGRRTPVDVAPIDYRVTREASVESVDVPPQAAEGAPVAVRISLRAAGDTSGALRLFREGEEVDINGAEPGRARRVAFGPGTRVEVAQVRLPEGRVHRFVATFEPDPGVGGALAGDTLLANNRAEGFTITPGRGSALVLRGAGATGDDALARALEAAGFRVESRAPEGLPRDPIAIQAFDLVALENVAAEEVPQQSQALLAGFVREMGGGLVMVGGPDSFGAGGWKGSPIEPLLPVRLDLPEQMLMPGAAVMFVLDSSGSMRMSVLGGMKSQQRVANEGAALAVRTLDKRDLVGVMEFNSDWRMVVPLEPNADPDRTAARIMGITPDGGTNIYPALEEAGRLLIEADAQVKHVILLTDGRSEGDANDGVRTAADLRARGITVSTIAVGDGADAATLEVIARAGGGASHRVVNPAMLPRVFLKETRVVRRPLIRETPFVPIDLGSGSPATLGLPTPFPTLGGLVLTGERDPRADGAMVTRALNAPGGEPVLAHWSAGLGQVAAWTSDAGRWAADWTTRPIFAQLWAQIARTIARPTFGRDYDLALSTREGKVVARFTAWSPQGRPLDRLEVLGAIYTPDGSGAPIRLTQVGPGVYEGEAPAPATGNYVVALTPRLGAKTLAPAVGAVARPAGPELRALASNTALLRAIAERTGGRVLDLARPDDANLFDRAGVRPTRAVSPLWNALLIGALAILLLDVGTRRVAWDRLGVGEVRAELARLARLARSGPEPVASVGALRRAKGRAGGMIDHAGTGRAPAQARAESLPLAPDRARGEGRGPKGRSADAARGPDGTPGAPPRDAAPEREESSLLAAKRRARLRYEGDGSTERGAGSSSEAGDATNPPSAG